MLSKVNSKMDTNSGEVLSTTVTTQHEEPSSKLPQTKISVDLVRLFLAVAAVLLVIFPFIVFLLTRDLAVIVGSTVLGTAIATSLSSVYNYYFRDECAAKVRP